MKMKDKNRIAGKRYRYISQALEFTKKGKDWRGEEVPGLLSHK